jgi:predicted metal-dependent hydrolase
VSETGRVEHGGSTIEYTVIRSRRRRTTMQITLDPEAGVVVAAPQGIPAEQLRDLVGRRAGWITRRIAGQALQPRPRRFASGESLPYLGHQAPLELTLNGTRRVRVDFAHGAFAVVAPASLSETERRAAIERAVVRWYIQRAAECLAERVAHWAALAAVAPTQVLVRDQRRRWGSCSPKGVLRFNWRLILAPPTLLDFVVVHELAHLRVRNHSAAFWAEVAKLLPDFKLRRAQLKELGPQLSL